MADTTFVSNVTRVEASWLNAINDFYYTIFQGAVTVQEARDALGLVGSVQTEATTSRSLTSTDAGAYINCTNASGCSVTVPPDAFPVSTSIVLIQSGAAAVTLVEGSGVTINTPSTLESRAQYSSIAIVQVDTNVWVATGDLAA